MIAMAFVVSFVGNLAFSVGVSQAAIPIDPHDFTVSMNPIRFPGERIGAQVSAFSAKAESYTIAFLLLVSRETERRRSHRIEVSLEVWESPRSEGVAVRHCQLAFERDSDRVWKGLCAHLEVFEPGLTVIGFRVPSHTLAELRRMGVETVMAAIHSGKPGDRFNFLRELPLLVYGDLPEAGSGQPPRKAEREESAL